MWTKVLSLLRGRAKRPRIQEIDDIDWEAYNWCENHGGPIAASAIEDWICLRCWVGFFMGLAFQVKPEIVTAIKKADGWSLGQSENGDLRYSKVYEDKSPWLPAIKIISYEEAIARGPNVLPHKKGGPPYVFERR